MIIGGVGDTGIGGAVQFLLMQSLGGSVDILNGTSIAGSSGSISNGI